MAIPYVHISNINTNQYQFYININININIYPALGHVDIVHKKTSTTSPPFTLSSSTLPNFVNLPH